MSNKYLMSVKRVARAVSTQAGPNAGHGGTSPQVLQERLRWGDPKLRSVWAMQWDPVSKQTRFLFDFWFDLQSSYHQMTGAVWGYLHSRHRHSKCKYSSFFLKIPMCTGVWRRPLAGKEAGLGFWLDWQTWATIFGLFPGVSYSACSSDKANQPCTTIVVNATITKIGSEPKRERLS